VGSAASHYRCPVPTDDADRARVAMTTAYRAVSADVERLDEGAFARPSRCLGWTRADLLFHLLLDAQRALVTCARPATGTADVDFVSYWAPFHPGGDDNNAHARFVRRAASAYRSDLVIAAQWRETAAAATHAADALPAGALVATQGHVLTAGDFLATLAVEATIHHLDLVAGDHGLAGPSEPGLALTRKTLDGILGQPLPAAWDDLACALRATGRAELTVADRDLLGPLSGRFPLLG
jgi:uncharacterized protein (TIGR03083 family)